MSSDVAESPPHHPVGVAPDQPFGVSSISAVDAASVSTEDLLARLGTTSGGLPAEEAVRRRAQVGPNAVRSHHARALRVLVRQLGNAVLILLAITALVSFFLGERTDTIVIAVILLASVGLGFLNEFRAERAVDALHSQVKHRAVVLRAGSATEADVTDLVPGDVVRVVLGEVVPADLRLLTTSNLECDESVLTGESMPVSKVTAPVPPGSALADLTCCAFMGTIVHSGSGTGVVVATGGRAEFGRIALGLGERQPETDFQRGLRQFSVLLLQVAMALTTVILAVNLALHRPLIDSLLFSLAIAVGITPQLLPAVVSTSLATGARQLAKRQVLVKRLVSIEDLGDMDVLVTDKTGTLTDGRISFVAALDATGAPSRDALRLGLLGTENDLLTPRPEASANALDAALWEADDAEQLVRGCRRIGFLPFDHDRQMCSAVIAEPDGSRLLVVKGAPEAVLARCAGVPEPTAATLARLFADGSRVIAVGQRSCPLGLEVPTAEDERELGFIGLLVFLDRPKTSATESLRRLVALGIDVRVCTGDNPTVAAKVCRDLGLEVRAQVTGSQLEQLDAEAFADVVRKTTIFARVGPEQKARVVTALRQERRAVGFLGDGVNDALALHAADAGISVDSGTDVAKDAADVILLQKDLGVLADGVTEGRRIFANTIKYVLMGTSSNFGNMFSAAAASAVLAFLPMLPSQILLNNLLYDAGQLAIPTDRVDEEQLRVPAHWDIGLIRHFMVFFGPISSLFDFLTFAVMLGLFHAGPDLFRAGWFTESLATQTLVIFVIRTRRSPFIRSRPSGALLVAACASVLVGAALPFTSLSGVLGFAPLPVGFFLALAGMTAAYLVLVEFAKHVFFADRPARSSGRRRRGRRHRIQRRAARFSVGSES